MPVTIAVTHLWPNAAQPGFVAVYAILDGAAGVMAVPDTVTTEAEAIAAIQAAQDDATLQTIRGAFQQNPPPIVPPGATRIGYSQDYDPRPLEVVKAVAAYLGIDKGGDTPAQLRAGILARLGV